MKEFRKTLKDIFTDSDYSQFWKNKKTGSFIPHSYAEVKNVYENGYADGIKQIEKGITAYKVNKAKRAYENVCGSQILIDNYLEGIPECFLEIEKCKHGKIDLYFDITILAMHDCNIWLENMGTLLGLIEDIEHQGTQVELHAITMIQARCDNRSNPPSQVKLTIDIEKNCLSDIAIVSHPSFIRRIVYSAIANYMQYSYLNGSKIDVEPDDVDGTLIPDMFQEFHTQLERENYLKKFFDK